MSCAPASKSVSSASRSDRSVTLEGRTKAFDHELSSKLFANQLASSTAEHRQKMSLTKLTLVELHAGVHVCYIVHRFTSCKEMLWLISHDKAFPGRCSGLDCDEASLFDRGSAGTLPRSKRPDKTRGRVQGERLERLHLHLDRILCKCL